MPKQLHMARRKMSHVIDELYMFLLRAGGDHVNLGIRREADGLRLFVTGNFDPARRREVERMAEVLRPEVRSPAMVEEFWELAGSYQHTNDSELPLVGQMVDEARVRVDEDRVEMELTVRF